MPTYVYKFIDTGETIEVHQAFSDDALTEAVHPTSGETLAVKKVFLPVGVTFKGGGFYKTDSRNGSSSSTSTSTSSTEGGSTSNGSSTSDSSSGASSSDGSKTSTATPAPATSTSSTASPAT
jgi:predicted nucleic acid-binding Zn ribbon protein